MKLLLDENLSRRLVSFLQHDYPGSNQVVLLEMESAAEKDVWQKAKGDGYVILTRDADFQDLSLVWGAPPPYPHPPPPRAAPPQSSRASGPR